MSSVELASQVDATIAVLRASNVVTEAMGSDPQFSGGGVPDSLVASMPMPLCVVAAAGSPALKPGMRDNVLVSVARVDVRCYGRSRHEAHRVALAVKYALKVWKYGVAERHLIHWFHHVSGPVTMEDPNGGWPVEIVTFNVQLADALTE